MRTLAGMFAGAAALGACSLAFDGAELTGGSTTNDAADVIGVGDGGPNGDAAADTSTDVDAAPRPCTTPGDRCPDGTVLAGTRNGVTLYTTPCDHGQSTTGSGCVGARARAPYNDGNIAGGVFVGATSTGNGVSNTTTLAVSDSNASAGGSQPHRAAKTCADLVFGGASDWYLPAIDELQLLYDNRIAIGQFEIEGSFYKSSTETHDGTAPLNAARLRFMDGYIYGDGDAKPTADPLRCVRKN